MNSCYEFHFKDEKPEFYCCMFWESPPIPLCKYIIWTYLINLISEKKCLTSMYINWKCFFQNSPIRLCNYVCQLNQSNFRKLKSTAKIIENVSSKTHPSVYPPCKPSASPPRERFGFFCYSNHTHLFGHNLNINLRTHLGCFPL